MEDLNEAGGVYARDERADEENLLNLDCMTVTGKTVGENIADSVNRNPGSYPALSTTYQHQPRPWLSSKEIWHRTQALSNVPLLCLR